MTIEVELVKHGNVAQLTFCRPPHNHASIELLGALADRLEQLDADPECRAVVLASDGKTFCAGADLATADALGGSGVDPVREFYDQALRLFRSRKPIVAAVQGAAIGAGLGLALIADFRVASPAARFSANFVKLGYHPGFGLTHTLPRLIGRQRADWMCLAGKRHAADEALAWGLVDKVVDAADLRGAAHAMAAEIAENAPLSLLAARQTLRGDLADKVAAALAIEYAEQAILKQTRDYAEGVEAVFERRPAHFVGA